MTNVVVLLLLDLVITGRSLLGWHVLRHFYVSEVHNELMTLNYSYFAEAGIMWVRLIE